MVVEGSGPEYLTTTKSGSVGAAVPLAERKRCYAPTRPRWREYRVVVAWRRCSLTSLEEEEARGVLEVRPNLCYLHVALLVVLHEGRDAGFVLFWHLYDGEGANDRSCSCVRQRRCGDFLQPGTEAGSRATVVRTNCPVVVQNV